MCKTLLVQIGKQWRKIYNNSSKISGKTVKQVRNQEKKQVRGKIVEFRGKLEGKLVEIPETLRYDAWESLRELRRGGSA